MYLSLETLTFVRRTEWSFLVELIDLMNFQVLVFRHLWLSTWANHFIFLIASHVIIISPVLNEIYPPHRISIWYDVSCNLVDNFFILCLITIICHTEGIWTCIDYHPSSHLWRDLFTPKLATQLIYLFFLTLLCALQWISLHWEILIMLFSHFWLIVSFIPF